MVDVVLADIVFGLHGFVVVHNTYCCYLHYVTASVDVVRSIDVVAVAVVGDILMFLFL